MQTLKLPTSKFDQVNTFNVEVVKANGTKVVKKVTLQKDYKVYNDGVLWCMANGATMKASYSAADEAERARLNQSTPVRHGDVVVVEGRQYKVEVKGEYSDCAVLHPV